MVTIIGLSVASQSLTALADPAPGEALNWWNLVPAAFASLALAVAWRHPSGIPYAALLLLGAVGVSVVTMFGDSEFSRAMTAVILGVPVLILAWVGIVLPLVAWRRGRWPTDAIEYVPYTVDAPDAEALRPRREALVAIGFAPRLVLARSEHGISFTSVVLTRPASTMYASIRRIAVPGGELECTQLFARTAQTSILSVADALVPSPFPPGPDLELLLFPGADAATLFAHLQRVRPAMQDALPLSDEALADELKQSMERYERHLIDAGYLSPAEDNQSRRYTLKGAFCAVLRPRWPWYALVRSRHVRDGSDALRKAAVTRGASGA